MSKRSSQTARSALLIYLACITVALVASQTAICQQTSAQPQPSTPLQLSTEPVVFTVTVTNKSGGYVMGLDKGSFAVLDGKAPQEITYFKGPDEPISVGIIFDASGSMVVDPNKRDLLKALSNEALSRFIRQSNESNIYFVIGFNEQPQLLLDWRRGVDAINDALVTLGSVKMKGNTALYDACYLALEKLNRSAHHKRAMILITDGQDNLSKYNYQELRRMLKESNVLLYAVVINSAADVYSALGMQGQGILDELATTSGGLTFFPQKPAHVRNIFDLLAAELRHQYSIGFNPLNYPGQREWHRIKIKLNLPADAPPEMQHLLVRSREGYYAGASLR